MLKRLAIFTLSAFLQASAPMPGQTVKPAAQSGNQVQKQSAANHSAAAPASPLVNKPVQADASNANGDEVTGDDKKNAVTLASLPPVTVAPITILDKQKTAWDHMLDWGPWIFDALLAIAAGLQVWLLKRTWGEIRRQANTMDTEAAESKAADAETLAAIKEQAGSMAKQTEHLSAQVEEMRAQRIQTANSMGKQSYELSQQTGAIYASSKAAEKTAEAAFLNAQAVLDSERAWLTVEVLNFEEPPPERNMIWIEVAITNRGKTPARLHSVVATSKLVPTPNAIADATPGKLPPSPDYSDDRLIELRGYDVIVAPGDTFGHIHVYIWSREWGEIKTRKTSLYVYGTIEYFDTVRGDRHTTSFCSLYAVPLPNFGEPTGFMFTQYIPDTYFRAT